MFELKLKLRRESNPDYSPYTLVIPAEKGVGKVFLGDVCSLDDREFFAKERIRTVITCCKQCHPVERIGPDAEFTTVVQINIKDSKDQDIFSHFASTYQVIDKGRLMGNVLVHCLAGVSRSASIVIAYVMRKHQKTYQEAYAYVKQRRNKVNPNDGFVDQLLKYQNTLKITKGNETSNKIATEIDMKPMTKDFAQISINKRDYADRKKLDKKNDQQPQPQIAQNKDQQKINTNQNSNTETKFEDKKSDQVNEPTRLENLKAEVNYMTLMMKNGRMFP